MAKSVRQELSRLLRGQVVANRFVLRRYAHDASLFEIRPQLVVRPRDSADVGALVKYIKERRRLRPQLSLTARSGGTDMSGGAINDSLIVDFSRYFKGIGTVENNTLRAQSGVYYRDFERLSLEHGLIMPAYPASRQICMMGGIVANNAGGEKSLAYGKTDRYVMALKVVLQDGHEYEIKPLDKIELKKKLSRTGFEGKFYRKLYRLLEANYELIRASRPRVSKDSTGYHLYDVWDRRTFDLTKLFVGSQGTLGLITEATFKLVPRREHSSLLVGFLPNLDKLGRVINIVRATKPTSFESFDDHTLRFALRFFPFWRRRFGWWGLFKVVISLVPEIKLLRRGLPRLVLMVEFEGSSQASNEAKIDKLMRALEPLGISLEKIAKPHQAEKFWLLRRESFNILRHSVNGGHTAPFIDDLIVPPHRLPEFLPHLQRILDKYQLLYTVAGHLGDGNFHIIPLMRLGRKTERAKIEPVLREVNQLVLAYGGSLSGEHNDGLVRGPFLEQMYGAAMTELFREVKNIFDPQNIFNPHKKTDATWEYSAAHMRRHF